MNRILDIGLRLAGLWLLAMMALLGANLWLVADAYRAQWHERNGQAAARLAAEMARLAAQGADARLQIAAAERWFAGGGWLQVKWLSAEGATLFERRRPPGPSSADVPGFAVAPAIPLIPVTPVVPPAPGAQALAAGAAVPVGLRVPAWFSQRVLPAQAQPGAAAAASTEVRVVVDASELQPMAWRMLRRNMLLWAAALALLLLGLAVWAAHRHRAVARVVRQAQALEHAQFVEAPEPRSRVLGDLSRAMNAVVRRLREQVAAQAEQVAQLQKQAQTDAVTGLPLRAFFVARLADLLTGARAPAASLLLVRVPELALLNERHGRDAGDRVLVAVADVLLTYTERIPGATAGRLAGQDFALGLPAAGAARETAAAIEAAMAAAPAARLSGVRIVVAGCDSLRGGVAASAALAAADSALARAESSGQVVVDDLPELGTTGARAWRELIAGALEDSRVRLGSFPVVDAAGELIHLECPLRVQVEPEGEFLVARRWLAMAARSRLMPLVDLAAVNLALAAIAADGQARCVHVAPRSLTSPGFARTLLSKLKAAGVGAARLSIEWSELSDSGTAAQALREVVPAWRQLGVRVGVEHAGGSPRDLPALKEAGLDYVKVDARHLYGVLDDPAARSHVESLVALMHGLGLQAIAEGVADKRQLEVLWSLGFDGATGAAVVALMQPVAEASDTT